MTDLSQMKLGKKAPRFDPRTLRLADFLAPKLPPPPKALWWTGTVTDFGMMLNDQLGDCTIAGAAHQIQVWTLNVDKIVTVSDSVVENAYVAWDGYVIGDQSTDNGGVEIDVLNKWKKFGLAGHALAGYADPNPQNMLHVKQAMCTFGGVYIGLSLPLTAQTQKTWDVVKNCTNGDDAPGSWGGHCVVVPNYDDDGDILTCITWGGLQQMTKAFWLKYVDECHALLSPDWLNGFGYDPNGIYMPDLQLAMAGVSK